MPNPRVFMDFSVEGNPVGRVIYELFADVVPKTTENFRALCTGSKGVNAAGIPLWYKGTPLHRIIAGFMVQGGDFTQRNGKGGESIYGGTFEDEDLRREIDSEGLLVMANRGKNTNGSQFFVSLRPCPHLAGKHVVFGRVVKGYDIIEGLSKLPTDAKDVPTQLVTISHCGELIMQPKKQAPPRPASPVASDRSRSPSRSRSSSRSPSRSPSHSPSPDRSRSKRDDRGRSRTRSPSPRRDSPSRSRSRSPSPRRRTRYPSPRRRSPSPSRSRSRSPRRHRSSRSKHSSSRHKSNRHRSSRKSRRSESPLLTEAEIAALQERAKREEEEERRAADERAREEERRREEREQELKRLKERYEKGNRNGGGGEGVVYKGRGQMRAPEPGRGGMRGW